MSTEIHLTYYGIEGRGPTVREAKAAAGREIEQIVKRCESDPLLVRIRDQAIIVYPRTSGWTYALITDEAGLRTGAQGYRVNGVYSQGSFEEIRNAGVKHLAQIAWTHDQDDAAFVQALPWLEQRHHSDLQSYFAWQRRYKAAKDAGKTDNEARDMADSR